MLPTYIKGFGLTEILVSLFLSSLIMSLLIQNYQTNRRQYHDMERSLELQMEVQWVREFIRDRIHQAGFTPCVGIDYLEVIDHRNTGHSIRSINFPDAGDDSLRVNRMSHDFLSVQKVLSVAEVLVVQKPNWNLSHPVLIADCQHAEINEISRIEQGGHGVHILLKYPLYYDYQEVTLGEWMEERWFIDTNRKGQKGLYYQVASHKEELSQKIHSLEASMQKSIGTLVEIIMGIENDEPSTFAVAVRGL